jgi:hypothetical protein
MSGAASVDCGGDAVDAGEEGGEVHPVVLLGCGWGSV